MWRTRRKQLITVFGEAMSHIASKASVACLTMLCDTKVDGESWIARKTPHTASGILPCEEIVRAISTTSGITTNTAPSGKL